MLSAYASALNACLLWRLLLRLCLSSFVAICYVVLH